MISRRHFIKALAAGLMFPAKSLMAATVRDRTLSMLHLHTNERLNIKYCSAGTYDQKALERINYFLRCHFTNEVKTIDVAALDLMCDIKDRAGKEREIHIISGYRSAKYNDYLAMLGRGVARRSLHMQGLAIDFTIPGLTNKRLFELARSFNAGGVGYYPEFVHIDSGRARFWRS